jgi:hypothetical protein
MRIIGLKEFLTLPVGTVYAKYAQSYTEGLEIKGENCGERDWIVQYLDPIANLEHSHSSTDDGDMLSALESGASASEPLAFNVMGRDGCFNDDQLFAVLERQDHERLVERLTLALAGLEPD